MIIKNTRSFFGLPYAYVSLALVLALGAMSFGFLSFLDRVEAGYLSNISDTLSTSNLGAVATHTISFINPSSTAAGQTISIIFDPVSDRFDGAGNVTSSDIQATGMTFVSGGASGCTGALSEIYLSSVSTSTGNESVTFTVCPTDSIASGTKSIVVNNKLTNPTSTAAYVVRISMGGNSADTRVAIIDSVIMQASVDTNFSFQISGVTSSITILGVTTTVSSTPTTLAFGTLPINSPVTMAQRLSVSTNAKNGFSVSVKEDQNLRNSQGDDIDLFVDGNATSTPSPWQAPSSTTGNENTFGHFGISSDDTDLNSGEFGTTTARWAGNFQATSSRVVFSHNGPSDGATVNKGVANALFRIQIGPLQEPGSDYTNTLTYIATPTF